MLQRLLLSFALAAISLMAQSSTGTATMTGAVTDTTGSVVPGAKITVTNAGAGFVFTSITTPEGTWYIPNLNPGSYQLRIEASGFKTYVQNGIVLRTAEQPRIDVKLEVGNVTESIQVTAPRRCSRPRRPPAGRCSRARLSSRCRSCRRRSTGCTSTCLA